MNAIFQRFWQICLLRSGPQDVPASLFLLGVILVVHALLGTALDGFTLPPVEALLSGLVGTLVMAAMVHAAVVARRRKPRFLQTLTALAGTEVVLGILALPVSVWYYATPERTVPSLLSLALLIWGIAITAHIAREALDLGGAGAVAASVFYTVISYWVLDLIPLH